MRNSLLLDRDQQTALRTAFESAGLLVFDVSEAGRDRDRLRQLWAALILLDLQTPRMRGLGIVRGLRSGDGNSPEAIIVTHGPIPAELTSARARGSDPSSE
jgi:DNA-binding response OmpR family regulator